MSLVSASALEIHQLSASPSFAMSLGAKELFHTNFLAFLLESDDPALEGMQRAIRNALNFPVTQGTLARCAVWREKNNLDLILVDLRAEIWEGAVTDASPVNSPVNGMENVTWQWESEGWYMAGGQALVDTPMPRTLIDRAAGRVLVIEAKLKSLPNLAQLLKYDLKMFTSSTVLQAPEDVDDPDVVCSFGHNGNALIERTLLSVSGQSMETPAVSVVRRNQIVEKPINRWNGASWRDLYNAMQAEVPHLAAAPIRETLIDYIQVLGALVKIIENVHRMSNQAHMNGHSLPTYGAVRKQVLAAPFRGLRLHDLLGKSLFDHWMTQFVTGPNQDRIPTGWLANKYVHYSKGVPALNIELVKNNHQMLNGNINTFRIGIQLQGPDFRLFVSLDKAWNDFDLWISQSTVLIEDWFKINVCDTPPVGPNQLPIMPATNVARYTNLLVFDPSKFLYSVVKIDDKPINYVEKYISLLIDQACEIAPRLTLM